MDDVTKPGDRAAFTNAQISAFRLHRHHLDGRVPRNRLPAVLGDTCGVQTQVTMMSRIALWARLRELTLADVDRGLVQKRTIVKVWSMRGALHLHPSSEVLSVLGALMPTRLHREQRWIHGAGLEETETTAMVLKALEHGPLTRDQLAEYLGKRLGTTTKNWVDGGWGVRTVGSANAWFLVQPAMARGLVCFGPSDGQEVTFVRVDRWLRDPPSMPPEADAEEAFVRRYLQSFGPADAHDLKAWSGIDMRRIRAILERLRDEIVEVDRDGRPGLLLRKDLAALEKARPLRGVVRLLPSFDPFMLGHFERSHLVDLAHYKEVYKDQGWLAPVVLVDGRVGGTWSYRRKPRKLEIAVRKFTSFNEDTKKKVREEADELSRFLEAERTAIRFAG